MADEENAAGFIFRGGHPALDFINTEKRAADGGIADLLATPADLGRWLSVSGLPMERDGEPVTPDLLTEAHALRAALRRLAAALTSGEAAPPDALATVNRVLEAGTGYTVLEADDGHFHARFQRTDTGALRLLIPIAEAAVALLTGPQASRVRACGNPRCILYFLDTSKNGTRRWCSMSGCGNVMKAAAHYQRTKAAGQ